MTALKLVLPALAAAAAALLLHPAAAPAYVISGAPLDLTQRDLRVFNNFSDPSANANLTPDLTFPGFVGAPLAIWKAAVEWGSELHSDGAGDPRQPGDLGSGGANFDFTWQGLASGVGGVDDNVLSEISGGSGGVLAFTESPTADGWRIRFYSTWTWKDDPAGLAFAAGEHDLQAVACHELGHALGLGHSNVPDATMWASIPPDRAAWRSIEDDDRAGVQALYGPRVAGKPRVTSYTHLVAGFVRVEGSGFAAAGNEVWFTSAGGGDGTPVTAGNLVSGGGGTAILVTPPAGAGPGDLLVKLPGSGHDVLSNAFPFDPLANPCFQPVPYGSGKLTSAGSVATIGHTGKASLQFDDLALTLTGAPPQVPAILFWGAAAHQAPFAGGSLLVLPPVVRAATLATDVFGFASVPVPIDATMVDVTRHYQFWFADPADPFAAGTSNALEIRFCP